MWASYSIFNPAIYAGFFRFHIRLCIQSLRASGIKDPNINQLVSVGETGFVIPAKAGIQFFALDPCFRRGDIVDFRFPQQIPINQLTIEDPTSFGGLTILRASSLATTSSTHLSALLSTSD